MHAGWLGDRTLWILQQALRGVSARHEALLNNVANAETPGYLRRDVRFREALRNAIETTSEQRISPGTLVRTHKLHVPAGAQRPEQVELQPMVVPVETARVDGNTVSLDQEMIELARNALEYQALSRQISLRYQTLLNVVREGGSVG